MIPYQGGKRNELKHLNDYFNTSDYDTFIDAYGGGGSVTLESAKHFEKVIYNDLDPFISDLATIIKNNPSDLVQQIESFPKTVDFRNSILNDNLEYNGNNMAEHLFLKLSCFRGVALKSPNITKGKFIISPCFKKFEKLKDRFKNIEVENMDAVDLIKQHKDDPKALIYLDPPYISTNQGNYSKKGTQETLMELFDFLEKEDHKCKIILHIEFIGYVYDRFKDRIKKYYQKNYFSRSASGKKATDLYQKYICICEFSPELSNIDEES